MTSHPPIPLSYVSIESQPQYASFGRRLAAWALDQLMLGFLRLMVLTGLGLIIQTFQDAPYWSEDLHTLAGFLGLAALYLIAWPYYAFMESSPLQATVGKIGAGLKVFNLHGERPSFMQATVRFFIRLISIFIFGIGFLMTLFTPRKQTLHDTASNCVVVRISRG